ncbi:AraC family transcriptional regulator [Agrobacterium rhizogenes]|jgi:AraC-like DNA-binding protein|uniref:AraC family transcriptional regulator n=1 Tax=Rhizobium rhizogenes NBRC 13257 TaxID=1220581 RepID=A0AA87Q899_RHIRH|nr:AraC family transcriptional regulator [Rhizobium rhizogenes]KAA6474584.1 AraC family transcriptional regulator [Agrobacterium sp. ICMP 7243]OCJ00041.1 cupin [Agrobacterium sp. 13-626]OCJ20440.1 cupin [Agrobacterium sp. B131/95]KEA04592.1 cupin [Rhizobium rhizogenes]MDJ1638359.1 AraC family transcriptional regulator [Rhizobium rhizogenes]
MTSHDRASQHLALASETHFPMMASREDFLSQILTLIRLRGELICSAELGAPWGLTFEPGSGYLHVVSEGELRLTASDGKTVYARAGDLLVMPQGTGHVIGTPGAEPVEARGLLKAQLRDDNLAVRIQGGGPVTHLVTGAFRFEGDNMPSMLAVLPSVIHIQGSMDADEKGWLEVLAQSLLSEARAAHPGSAIMISRLIDVLVIRAMRIWVRTAPPEEKGWLAALADARISRALKAIHDEPFRRRTVAELAAMAGMSRSNFAERFSTLVGAGPLHYQTRWRLLLASDMLRRSDARVSDVARRVGYDSEAAFSRAFKAQFGIPPVMARAS